MVLEVQTAARAASELGRGEAIIVDGDALLALELCPEMLPDATALITSLPTETLAALGFSNLPPTRTDNGMLALAKHVGLLPALLVLPANRFPHALKFTPEALKLPKPEVIEAARAALPIHGAEKSTVVSFREKHNAAVHLALVIGTPGETPLTRVHSSCVTGDLLGSLRCDCGDQLKLALARITAEGGGVLLYLHQEGRDIGITNKLRAYRLQDQGYDTYEANRLLGFADDERDFAIAAAMLKALGFSSVRLLTNNPDKAASLEKHGIRALQRIPLTAAPGKHNEQYLSAKRRAGHQF